MRELKKKKTQDPSKARRKGKSFHESGLHEEDKEVKNSIVVQKCKELVKEKVWKKETWDMRLLGYT